MSAPRNNLEELRRKQGLPGSRGQSPEPAGPSAKSTKFKPSKSSQTPENVTVRKQPDLLPAFRTSGFREDVDPVLNFLPSADTSRSVVEISSDEDAGPTKSSGRLPVKRMSPGSAYDPESSSPSKRPKIGPRTEKQNQLDSWSGKGKARGQLDNSLDPPVRDSLQSPRRRIVNVVPRMPSPLVSSGINPLPPLDPAGTEWPNLVAKSADELGRMLNSNFELCNTVNDKINKYNSGEDMDCDFACMVEVSKLLARRNKAIMTARSSIEGGSASSSAHSRTLSIMVSPSTSISQAGSRSAACCVDDTRTDTQTYTVIQKNVAKPGFSMKDAAMPIPDSDDIWESVGDIPIERKGVAEATVSVSSVSRHPAKPFHSSSFDSAMASSSTAESSSASLSRNIVQLAATHTTARKTPVELTKTPFYPEVKRKLRSTFGLTTFRTNQLEAISATLSGEDSVVLMPTGGGKSLCYQLPAVCDTGKTHGVTVVICPLLALMVNQVDALKQKGVDVAYFNSDQDAEESDQVVRRLRAKGNRPRILYITPEKLKHSSVVIRLLNDIRDDRELARFVIDEGHLVIKWGRDFRDAYRYLECLRTNFPGIPIMALTATATQEVKEDLIRLLGIRGCHVFWQSMNRPNLNYEVRKKSGVEREIVQFILTNHSNHTGIIYAATRQTCETLAKSLRENHRLKARHFHAGMQAMDKQDALDQWQSGQCKIIVATIAFGMGIDKPDVRYVIHHELPNDLDGYYQETGRAGRDGQPADCILFYSFGDVNKRRQRIRANKDCDNDEKEHQERELLRVAQFCQNNVDCRRTQVLAYYNENFNPALCNENCDNCRNTSGVEEEDVTDMAVKIIKLAEVLIDGGKQNVTRNQLLEFLWGKGSAWMNRTHMRSHELFGCGKDMPRDRTERIADRLESLGMFRTVSVQRGDWSVAYLQVAPSARDFVKKGLKLFMKFRTTPSKAAKAAVSSARRHKRPSTMGDEPPVAGGSSKKAKRIVPAQEDVLDLYLDDDVFNFGSPKKPATRARTRAATTIEVEEDEDEDEDNADRPYQLLDSLKDVRARVAEERDVIDPRHVIGDHDLFMIATIRPTDRETLEEALTDADVSPMFWAHAWEFLACCRPGSGVQAHSRLSNVVSITNLHQQFSYQGKYE